MFELFDMFSQQIVVTGIAVVIVLVPVIIFVVVKAAKKAGEEIDKDEKET